MDTPLLIGHKGKLLLGQGAQRNRQSHKMGKQVLSIFKIGFWKGE